MRNPARQDPRKPDYHHRFQNEATYFQLLGDGKAFLEYVLAFVLALGFQLKHKATCDGVCLTRHSHYVRVRLGGITIWESSFFLRKFPRLFCFPRRHVGYTNFSTFEFANSIRRLNEKPSKSIQQGLNAGERLSDCHLNKQRLINSLGAEVNESVGRIEETLSCPTVQNFAYSPGKPVGRSICARIPWVPLDNMPLGCNGHALLFARLAAIEDIKRLGRQPL